MKTTSDFIIIDDNRMDLFLIEKVIKTTFSNATVMSFIKPDVAVEYFSKTIPDKNYTVLLDINMPVITGFDFLDIFHTLDENIKSHYEIFILTSSSNLTDFERGNANPYVAAVLTKPLSSVKLLEL